jgi:hypothetical protein
MGLGDNFSEAVHKVAAIYIVPENLPPLYPANHNVVESARSINASFSRHQQILTKTSNSMFVNKSIPVPYNVAHSFLLIYNIIYSRI